MIPVVVISLEQSAERRGYIAEHLAQLGIPFRFFSAFDGAALPASAKARYEPTIPVGAMGCAESHLAVLREIAIGSADFVCVLEDDASLSPSAPALLDGAVLAQLPAFDVLRLEISQRHASRRALPIAEVAGLEIVATRRHHIAMTAQIYSREGARKIIQGVSFLRVALDVALFLDCYVMGLRVVEVRPGQASSHSLPSTIGPGRMPPYSALEWFLLRRVRTRELRAQISFIRAWGIRALAHSLFPTARPSRTAAGPEGRAPGGLT